MAMDIATDMARQMVGDEVACHWCGGDPSGGLGTDVAVIKETIDAAWSDAGVAVFVDLGGAEMNAEMAIQMFDDDTQGKIAICHAPLVEGAVIGATEASGGSTLDEVRRAAEEYES